MQERKLIAARIRSMTLQSLLLLLAIVAGLALIKFPGDGSFDMSLEFVVGVVVGVMIVHAVCLYEFREKWVPVLRRLNREIGKLSSFVERLRGGAMKSNLILLPALGDLQPLAPAVLYEVAAAKYVKIAIEAFREFVNQGVIPFRTHPGRSRRIYLKVDLDAYLRNLPLGEPTRGKIDPSEDPSKPERKGFRIG